MSEDIKLEGEAYVQAIWDEDAELYFSDTNIPGLFIEAPTLGGFEEVLFDVAPELILENIVKPQLVAQGFDVEIAEHPGERRVPYDKLPEIYPLNWQGSAPRQVKLAVA